MSGLPFTLTTAGRRALVNPANTGVNALTVSHIGVSALALPGGSAAQEALTALPNERKRLTTFGGAAVSPDTIHVTLRDETDDAYTLRAFGLYLSNGVLLAVYSQPAPIAEKVAASMLLLSADLVVASPIAAAITFGAANFMNPPATDTVAGVVELATDAEISAGVDGVRAVTPLGLARRLAAWAQGFAAAVHGHAVADIAGLGAALATKAEASHVHDAAQIESGVLNVARLPDLAMAKITGLVAALAGKANSAHGHAGEDITSGVVPVARLPDLAMAKITGLVAALAGKAEAGHVHDAGDVTTGVFNVARLPDLAMAKITGLVAALAGKADVGHVHDAGGVTTGVFNVARLPDLAMAKITGLVAALAAKANLNESVRFLGVSLGTGNGHVYSSDQNVHVRSGPAQAERFFDFLANGDFRVQNGNILSQHGRVWDPGNLRFASSGETLGGAGGDLMLSPAGLWSFMRSIGRTGYAQIPGTPLVLQWGFNTGSVPEGQVTAALPIAFGGGCLFACAIPRNSAGSSASDYFMQIVGRYLDRIVFFAQRANSSSGNMAGFEWFALGLASGTPDPAFDVGGGYPPGGGGGGGDQIEL